ncbi:MAG: hypothetical protein ACQEP3_00090 [Patescibacteria group bacterium]
MAEKKYYCIEGTIEFKSGNWKTRAEDKFSDSERHLQAYSLKQATFLFAKRFTEKLGRKVFIGNADIFEVEPPTKQSKSKDKKQLKLFDL